MSHDRSAPPYPGAPRGRGNGPRGGGGGHAQFGHAHAGYVPYRPPYPYAPPSVADNGPSASKVDDSWLRAQQESAARNYAPPTPHHHPHHGGSWRPAVAPSTTGWGSPQPHYGRGGPRGGNTARVTGARSSPPPAPPAAAEAPAPAAPAAAAPARTERPKWLCPACQFHNFMNRRTCKSCNGARPPKEEIVDPTIVQVEVPAAPAADTSSNAIAAGGATQVAGTASGTVADATSKDQGAANSAPLGDAASAVVPADAASAAAASAADDANVVPLSDSAAVADDAETETAGKESAPVASAASVVPVAPVAEDAAQPGPAEVKVEATVEVQPAPADAAVDAPWPDLATDATAVEDEVDSILAAAAAASSPDDQDSLVPADAATEPVVSRDMEALADPVERDAVPGPALETLAADLAAPLPEANAELEPPVVQAAPSTESLPVPDAAPPAESRAAPEAAPAPSAVAPASSAAVKPTPASFDPNDPWDNPDLSAPVSSTASIRSVAVSDPWGEDDAEPTTAIPAIPSSAAWTCTRCAGKNAASTPYCDTCDAPNPACVQEWTCTQCRHANFPTVTACVACKRPRHVVVTPPPTPLDRGVADLRAALPAASAKPRAVVVPVDKPLPPTPTPDPAPAPAPTPRVAASAATTTRDSATRTSTPTTRTSSTSTSSTSSTSTGRPMTSTFVAKRLIGGALGLRTTNADDRKRHETALAEARAAAVAKREPPRMTLSPRGAPARLLTPPKPTAAAPPRNDWTAMWGDEGGKGLSGAYYGGGTGGW
ncbi:hypothetical protein AMAG_07454 [Allomyces macrogynus ATCC 38327]|uniref:RanBP2-type domain-containing protein n=1 Tax=Allomyces macrogynus (strain ATCC 38327) TaxID=578462 RepID=A0A0L0SID8_ALLM3|nr:hypothetical protein AMAG_07454 [Allomyces macrogynus ATCC 38327]|eukprot:KNE62214.1 hypothetical protein AMAG_07454 [Allomyces macrogynus ATCC 38327]